jgi:hypothetical protein
MEISVPKKRTGKEGTWGLQRRRWRSNGTVEQHTYIPFMSGYLDFPHHCKKEKLQKESAACNNITYETIYKYLDENCT